jgi:hypothetical protein
LILVLDYWAMMRLRYWMPLLLAAAGCFYPPTRKPVPAARNQITLTIPFDLAWDAVHAVVNDNNFHIIAEDPNNGIIESQAIGGFSLKDADCGDLRGIAQKYHAEPDPGASAVYNFAVKPDGNEATTVILQAVFTSPVQVPLHPMSAENCVSTGVQEARLLKQIKEQAGKEHRPEFKPPTG